MEEGIRHKRQLTTNEETINCAFIDDAECPSLKDCPECEYLTRCKTEITKRWVKIPDYVFEKLKKLHPSTIKVFLYINRKAELRSYRKDYGTCKLSISKIKKAINLSETTIRENIKELMASKIINCEIDRHEINKEWKTGHTFYILWMFLDKEILDKETKEKNNSL